MLEDMHEQYLVDEKGQKKSVLLDWAVYQKLVEELEDLRDMLELEHAEKTAEGFTSYGQIREHLKAKGLV